MEKDRPKKVSSTDHASPDDGTIGNIPETNRQSAVDTSKSKFPETAKYSLDANAGHLFPHAHISAESLQLFPKLVPGLQAPIELVDAGVITFWNHKLSTKGLDNTIHTVLIVLDVETQSSWIIQCEHNIFFFKLPLDDSERKRPLGYTYWYAGGRKHLSGTHKSRNLKTYKYRKKKDIKQIINGTKQQPPTTSSGPSRPRITKRNCRESRILDDKPKTIATRSLGRWSSLDRSWPTPKPQAAMHRRRRRSCVSSCNRSPRIISRR